MRISIILNKYKGLFLLILITLMILVFCESIIRINHLNLESKELTINLSNSNHGNELKEQFRRWLNDDHYEQIYSIIESNAQFLSPSLGTMQYLEMGEYYGVFKTDILEGLKGYVINPFGNNIILTEAKAYEIFNTRDIIGVKLILDGEMYTVTGTIRGFKDKKFNEIEVLRYKSNSIPIEQSVISKGEHYIVEGKSIRIENLKNQLQVNYHLRDNEIQSRNTILGKAFLIVKCIEIFLVLLLIAVLYKILIEKIA